MSAIALTTVGLLVLGGCTWGQADPEQELQAVLDKHVGGEINRGVVGAYVSYTISDAGASGVHFLERVDGGWILAVSMRQHDEILAAAKAIHGPRGRLGVENAGGGPRFTIARSIFAELGGYRGKLNDGYFSLPDISSGRYLVCYAKPSLDYRASFRVIACSRNVEIDPVVALQVRKVSTEGGGFFVDKAPIPDVSGLRRWPTERYFAELSNEEFAIPDVGVES